MNYLTHDRKIFHSGEIINELKYELDAAGSSELQCDLKVSVAVFDHNAKKLQFSGINQDMMVFDGEKSTVIKGESGDHFEDAIADKIDIQEGCSYYMYSNGYYNQDNEDGVKFSYDKFEEMIKSIQSMPMSEQREFLMSNLNTWKSGNSLNDDISIIGFKL